MLINILFFALGSCLGENELERRARSIFIDKVVIENSSDEFIRVYIEVRDFLKVYLEKLATLHNLSHFS